MSLDGKTRILPEVARVTVGTQLSGIYELDERLASGGMGEVYRGHNIQTGDLVAIKIVLPEFARDETILSLFRKEASILNHLSHEAIVRYHVFTIDQSIGRPYLAMEFVDGEPLSDIIRRGPMAADDVRGLCVRLAAGLATVHDAHVFHRDLSPDNIILPEGRVERAKIIDFGIARSTRVGEGTLLGGRFAGKYNYVSPEQLGLFGGEISERSDIYSLGLVLAAALRGKPLDMSGSQWEVVDKRRSLPDLTGIDDDLRQMLEAMLQPDPADRPADMAEIMQAARAGMAPDEVPTWRPRSARPPEGAGPRPDAPVYQHPWIEVPPAAHGTPASSPAGASPPFVPHVSPAFLSKQPAAETKPVAATPRGARARPLLIAATAVVILTAGTGAYLSGFIGFTPPPTFEEMPRPAETVTDEEPVLVEAEPKEEEPRETATVAEPPEPEPSMEETSLAEGQSGQVAEEVVEAEAEPEPDEEIVAVLDPLRREPAVEAVNGVAERISWLHDYSGGDCFYATVISATDTATEIEGFGTAVEPFAEMLAAFQSSFGMEPDVNVRPIMPTQCAITDFMRGLHAVAGEAPQLTLHRTSVPSGSPISGMLEFAGGQKSNLLLIDHKGMAFNLNGRLDMQARQASFSIPIGLSAAERAEGRAVPQVIIALTAQSEIRAASFSQPTPASVVLPEILAEIRARGLESAAAAKYFRLGG